MNRKFFIKTLGCKTNAIEEQIIIEQMEKNGWQKAQSCPEADIFILNSCSVTSHSDSQSAYLLNKAKRENPRIINILTGCCAQTIDLHKNFNTDNIDLILGNNEKLDIYNYIDKYFKEHTKKCVGDIFKVDEFNCKIVENPNQTRVSIKIQEGCNNRCSYCIIPYARGNSRSNSVGNILSQIKRLVEFGTKEIVLTGIHIGQWGSENNSGLIDLLCEIEKTEIARYRLGSLYINELDDNMIDFLKKSKKFCAHFHLSLQSLCDKTLKNMNRNYCANEAVLLVNKLYKTFGEPFLGCDIIAGFPDESEEDFKITYDNLNLLPISYIHAFPYSAREGTAAFNMKNQIQDAVKTGRVKMLNELCTKKHKEFLKRNKNRVEELLYEKKSPKTGAYSAITRNYIKVYIKDKRDDLRNTLKVVNLGEFEELY